MVTLTSADNALKSVYLNVLSEQLNIGSNAFFSKVKQTTKDVYGKEIIKLAPYGLNGGIGAGSETGTLPVASAHKFVQFKTGLKNLYGTISISDKAIRASASHTGAFINLLDDEMESLIKSSSFNLGRMIYGDGTGKVATVASLVSATDKTPIFDSVRNLVEGMKIDIYNGNNKIKNGILITYVDRQNKQITCSESLVDACPVGSVVYVAGSKDNEITGLARIFDKSEGNKILYGVDRTENKWLYPYVKNYSQATNVTDAIIQTALNSIEEQTGSQANFIAVSNDVRNAYQTYLTTNRRYVDVATLNGGYKAMTYAGIPIVYDRFVEEGSMLLLNTNDFNLHQLCDWEWITGENGNVLIPSSTTPTYTATLVKYAELICDRPAAQGKISNLQ